MVDDVEGEAEPKGAPTRGALDGLHVRDGSAGGYRLDAGRILERPRDSPQVWALNAPPGVGILE
jgi:hypothetical protein